MVDMIVRGFEVSDEGITIDKVVKADGVVAVQVSATIDVGYTVDEYVATGAAKCDPRDKADPEIGTKLALGRAIRQLGRDILKDAQNLVNANARVIRQQEEAAALARSQKAARAEAAQKAVAKTPAKRAAKKAT